MLVSDGRARHPVAIHVRVLGIRRVDLPPAGQVGFRLLAGLLLRVLEVLQILGFFQIEVQAAVSAVHFERVEVLAAARVPCRFERAHRAIRKLGQEHAGIIDTDGLNLRR